MAPKIERHDGTKKAEPPKKIFSAVLLFCANGSRVGTVKLVRNLLVVWLLAGRWHGASWNFALRGLCDGVLTAAEKLWLDKWMQR